MRILSVLSAIAVSFALAAGSGGIADAAKAPKKTKMGCIVGKEKWDASAGKCVAAKPVKKAAKKKA